MNKQSGIVLVSVSEFKGTTTPDKNGLMPKFLTIAAGTAPNRNTISGTVAQSLGIEEGKTYLMQWRKRGTDVEFGEDYNWTKLQEVTSGLEIVKIQKELGEGNLITIEKPENTEYKRKGDKVVSAQAQRVLDGKYKPASGTPAQQEEEPKVFAGGKRPLAS